MTSPTPDLLARIKMLAEKATKGPLSCDRAIHDFNDAQGNSIQTEDAWATIESEGGAYVAAMAKGKDADGHLFVELVNGLPAILSLVTERDTWKARATEAAELLRAGPDKVLRCAFCGHEYPEGTPTHKAQALSDHIRVCPEHPIGKELRTIATTLERAEELARAVEARLADWDAQVADPKAACYQCNDDAQTKRERAALTAFRTPAPRSEA